MLTKNEKEFYARQILAYGIGFQEKLKSANVLVIGAGGLGSAVLPILTGSGLGQICIYDGDVVERSNLSRQTIFSEADLGVNKAVAASQRLKTQNPYIEIKAFAEHLNERDNQNKFDLILDGSDSLARKFETTRWAVSENIACIIGSVSLEQSHVHYARPPVGSCYHCIFQQPPPTDVADCKATGIQSSAVQLCGSLMAHCAIEHFAERLAPGSFYRIEKNIVTHNIYEAQATCPLDHG